MERTWREREKAADEQPIIDLAKEDTTYEPRCSATLSAAAAAPAAPWDHFS
jgi:hypothetical protein